MSNLGLRDAAIHLEKGEYLVIHPLIDMKGIKVSLRRGGRLIGKRDVSLTEIVSLKIDVLSRTLALLKRPDDEA